MKTTYGLEQARAQLPRIAAEAHAGHTSVITRHGEPMAAVVPMSLLQSWQAGRIRKGGILALRGTGRHMWLEGAGQTVANLRDEWRA
ncbi:MAG: type II toxin-antitoxin system Phd/YefM family antitoxin [Burkholderiales bacterium]|nr:type II toxin-antitoxin system Phd/YefM family antitoxin [Burkholderiales bacterium]